MCPAGKSTGCISGSKTQANITSLDLEVPKPGDWNTSVWLRDSAGNAQPATAANVRLRYDNDSPDVVFAAVNADDPARIHVSASDPSSAIAGGELSLRRLSRNGSWGHWRSYPGDLEPGGFSVMLDDEHLRDGYYQLAARAVDDAGNERSTDRTPDGSPASITLPVRLKTKLRAGKARRVRRGRHARAHRLDRRRRDIGAASAGVRTTALERRKVTPCAAPLSRSCSPRFLALRASARAAADTARTRALPARAGRPDGRGLRAADRVHARAVRRLGHHRQPTATRASW